MGMAWLFTAALLLSACQPAAAAHVQLVVLHSPICVHCQEVIETVITPLQQEHGERLEILFLDVTGETGRQVYLEAARLAGVDPALLGVPVILLEDEILAGDAVEEEFPQSVADAFQRGGAVWPDLDSLRPLVTGASTPAP